MIGAIIGDVVGSKYEFCNIKTKEFSEGSMLPKVEACIDFASKSSGYAVITSLKKAKAAINGKAGTVISKY